MAKKKKTTPTAAKKTAPKTAVTVAETRQAPDDDPDVTGDETVEEEDDPVTEALRMLSAEGLYGPHDVVRYLEDHVRTHPDIDAHVDRGTERAALLSSQITDERAVNFQLDRWGVERKPTQRPGWKPGMDTPQLGPPMRLAEPLPGLQTTEQAWDEARKEGHFQ
ncbi:MAG: hypothetical protein ACOC9R_01335 [bacterium]